MIAFEKMKIWGFKSGALRGRRLSPRRGGVRKTVWTRIGKEIPAFAGMTRESRGDDSLRNPRTKRLQAGGGFPHQVKRRRHSSISTAMSSLSRSVPKACR